MRTKSKKLQKEERIKIVKGIYQLVNGDGISHDEAKKKLNLLKRKFKLQTC